MRKPNKAPIFDGRSALDRMTDGSIEDLKIVRQYLDAEAQPLDYPNRFFCVLKGKVEITDDLDELPDDINANDGRAVAAGQQSAPTPVVRNTVLAT